MTDEELLKCAEKRQSYLPGSETVNEYNGLDNLSAENIQDDRMYALVHDGNIADLEAGKPTGIEYFFDQATYDNFVNPSTGEFDAQALSESLQVKPYQNREMLITDGHAEYRNSIACFDRNGDIRTPTGVCEANTQFGGGGAHQAFIPEDESKELQSNGTLQYNGAASNIHTGKNYSISADDYDKIKTLSDKRCKNCEAKGLAHPEPAVCKNEFAPNPGIEGTPFHATNIANNPDDAKRETIGNTNRNHDNNQASNQSGIHSPPEPKLSGSGEDDAPIPPAKGINGEKYSDDSSPIPPAKGMNGENYDDSGDIKGMLKASTHNNGSPDPGPSHDKGMGM